MKIFTCLHCGQPIYFENTVCEKCASPLGFEPETLQLLALVQENGYLKPMSPANGQLFKFCANSEYAVCNWLLPVEQDGVFCRACELNRTIPNLGNDDLKTRWKKIELAKHRLIYSLLRMKLPVFSKTRNEEKGLAFDFIGDDNKPGSGKILTGHDQGIITINIAEADEISREMARKSMHELYRTLLGHFRHEIGHYYWDLLISDSPDLAMFRQLFGDEQKDYNDALKLHYEQGAPPDWNSRFISAYASAHPWEDWAETWAHYMHIIDTLETAHSFGLRVDPPGIDDNFTAKALDPYKEDDFGNIFSRWLPLTFAMNSINRSMGLQDLYPFVVSEIVINKMKFIHEVVGRNKTEETGKISSIPGRNTPHVN